MAKRSRARGNTPRNYLDPKYVRTLLTYNKKTGLLTWKARSGRGFNPKTIGKIAGTIDSSGHRQIEIGRIAYMAHHLAWAIVTGEWPTHQIDHKDRNPDNNAWKNLRKCTHAENKRNQKIYKSNRLGIKGVSLKKNKFNARITLNKQTFSLGWFSTAKEAYNAYCEAAKKLHGVFARLE